MQTNSNRNQCQTLFFKKVNFTKIMCPSVYFVTSNPNKLQEFKKVLPISIENIDLDLDEIQTTNLEVLLQHKLKQAYQKVKASVLVEDTALYFNAWHRLPGPFIKWFLQEQGLENLVKALSPFEDKTAKAVCLLGYTDGQTIQLFEGSITGKIVMPRGENGFGWDSIFQPEDAEKTLGEMSSEQKNNISMRHEASEKLKQFLTDTLFRERLRL